MDLHSLPGGPTVSVAHARNCVFAADPNRDTIRPMIQQTESALLYERVAERIAGLIDRGTFRPGERVPSVRKLAETQDVSIATALQAYRVLEDRGLVEARPQSGYYVRPRLWRPPPEPETSSPSRGASRVGIGDLIMKVLRSVRDPDVIQLGAAVPSPDLIPARQLNRSLASLGRRLVRQSVAYDMPPGNEALRIQVARRAMESGCALTPDDIVTTCGGQEALMLSLRAVAKPGDTVAIESPTFYGILQAIEVLGLRALEIPTHPREGISLEALRLAVGQRRVRACLFVLNFNNPVGACMSDANKKKLVQMLAEREIPLVEDDIYGELCFEPPRPRTAKAYDRKGLVLLCSSFSKTLAPGYRVGWVTPGRFKEQIERLKFVSTIATPTLPQMAIADFLANGGYDRHLRRVRKAYADQVRRTTEAIGRFFPEGTKVTRPRGGYVLWVELPKRADSLELHRRALEEKISVAPGPIFSPKKDYRNFIRISCGMPWSERVEHALMTLGRLAAEMSREGKR